MERIRYYWSAYGEEAMLLAGILLAVLGAGYWIFYKKIGKRTKVKFRQVIYLSLLFAYLILVAGVTFLSRGNGMMDGFQQKILPLFYSYKSAWYADGNERTYIVMNIFMFVPFGVLLPMTFSFFQKFWMTYLAGFLGTVGIESLQYVFHRGVCEMDDVLNNTLGAMIGYGIFAVVRYIKAKWTKQKASVLGLCVAQIPLCVTVVLIGFLYGVFDQGELGRMTCQWSNGYNMQDTKVSSLVTFDESAQTLPVYETIGFAKEEGRAIAEGIFAYYGTDIVEERELIAGEEYAYYDKEQRSVQINYSTGTILYFNILASEEEIEDTELQELSKEEILDELEQMKIHLPESVDVVPYPGNESYDIRADFCEEDGVMYNGTALYRLNHKGDISTLQIGITRCKKYKEYATCSQQEAYEKIKRGEFYYPEQFWGLKGDIEVQKADIDYVVDSKGYYQPVYVFWVEGFGLAEIRIPAIV